MSANILGVVLGLDISVCACSNLLENKLVYKRCNSILEQLADLHKDLLLLDINCIINKLEQADAPFNLKQKWHDLLKQKYAEENI